MKLTKKTLQLICELEAIIGDDCYNPNSYDGWSCEYGCSFRYPVTYVDKDDNQRKCWSTISDLDKKHIDTVCYKFGSNHLFIGNALVKVLETLEQKYNISFDELVKGKK